MGLPEVEKNKQIESDFRSKSEWTAAHTAGVVAGLGIVAAVITGRGHHGENAPANHQPPEQVHTTVQTEAPATPADIPAPEHRVPSVEDLPPQVSSPTDIPPLPGQK